MAILDVSLADEWAQVWEARAKREALYGAALKNGNKLLITEMKAKLEAAEREYDNVCGRL